MYGLVPAAGQGTRLRPRTESKPKGLILVAGKPILTRCFERLEEAGVDELIVIVGYRAEAIIETFGDEFRGLPIQYVYQRAQQGLADAVLHAEPVIDGSFILLNGDNILDGSLGKLVTTHNENEAPVTALAETVSVEEATETGVFVVEDGSVVGMVEKPNDPPSTLVSAGCYICDPIVFTACALLEPDSTGEYEFSTAIDVLLSAGNRIDVVEFDGWRTNINTEADIAEATARFDHL